MPDDTPTPPELTEPTTSSQTGPTEWSADLLDDDRPVSPSTSSSRIMFTAEEPAAPQRDQCPVCRGTGYKMTVSDFLRESVGLIEGHEDEVVQEFYRRLLMAAPGLAALFPDDLLTTDETHHQRDRLVAALAALATTYDPYSPAKMEQLDTALAAFGRHHSNFARPDGTSAGATLDEYYAVKVTLIGVFHDFAGEAWLPVYDAAWSEAFDYAAAHMLVAQFKSPQRYARQVRSTRTTSDG